jgi:hypothetical protein
MRQQQRQAHDERGGPEHLTGRSEWRGFVDVTPGIRADRANIGTLAVDIGSVGGDLHGASAGDHGGTEVAGTEHVARHDGTGSTAGSPHRHDGR